MYSLLFTTYYYGNKLKSSEMNGHVACMGELRNAYFSGKPDINR